MEDNPQGAEPAVYKTEKSITEGERLLRQLQNVHGGYTEAAARLVVLLRNRVVYWSLGLGRSRGRLSPVISRDAESGDNCLADDCHLLTSPNLIH